ncbi:MAG: hypothetical protein XE08_0622 [Parcubacteria bacterium 32_520]|nr:MAG: hypothetical protein XE08_0622 [Parcubacteria bacterium 32_520]
MKYKKINNFKDAFEIKINLLVTGINIDLNSTKKRDSTPTIIR